MKPYCVLCKTEHEKWQAHVWPKVAPKPPVKAVEAPHQRWDRRAYNAFMRDYMKVWRAVKSGRACSWPK